MTWFRCGGGGSGIPAALKNRMNAVLNKKFETSVDYPPNGWPDDVNLLGLLEEKTQASSSVCAFSDGADVVPTKSLVVTIPPTLSGVSVINEKQTGRNLVDGYVDYSNVNKVVEPQFYKAGTYTFSCVRATNINGIYVRKGSVINLTAESISSKYNTLTSTFSVSEDGYYFIQLYRNTSSPTWEDDPVTNVMLEYGSTAHAYEPYTTPTTYTASLGRTIYGGTADIVNGIGTEENRKFTVLNNSVWIDSISFKGNGDTAYIQINYSPASNGRWQDLVCLHFTPTNIYAGGTQQGIGCYSSQFYIRDSRFTSKQDFLDYLTEQETLGKPLEICYKLNTPTDFTFTGQEVPTKLGYNAFWSDEGDTEVTYRSSGTITPVLPTLISKTITENGTYNASDDSADGYGSVTVNVSGCSCERLLYLHCVNNDQIEIPAASSITQGVKYSQYVSYDSTTKKFTVLQDFTAIIIAWVYTYQTYESSRSDGALYINNSQVIQYEANGTAAGSTGGVYLARNFKQNDTFNVYTPTRDGYPQQNLKIYLLADVPDNIYTFTDENA